MPFAGGGIIVQEVDDTRWRVMEPIIYQGNEQVFTVEQGFETDFASVPQIFTWLIPKYGRYTKAAILHDWLWMRAGAGGISYSDADGIFRRSMRELGVSFLRRWLMWGAVRLAAVRKAGLSTLWHSGIGQFAAFIAVVVPGFLFVLVPGLVVLTSLGVFYVAECVVFLILKVAARRKPTGEPVKKINRPGYRWTSP